MRDAKVAMVHAELYDVSLALEMYADDHEAQLPPVRVDCSTNLATHRRNLGSAQPPSPASPAAPPGYRVPGQRWGTLRSLVKS